MAAAYLFCQVWVLKNGGFGSGDLIPFWIPWNVLFGLAIVCVACVASTLALYHRRWWAFALLGVIGAATSVAFTWLHAMYLGPWVGAWSFPVGLGWLFGGVVGMTLGALPKWARRATVTAAADPRDRSSSGAV